MGGLRGRDNVKQKRACHRKESDDLPDWRRNTARGYRARKEGGRIGGKVHRVRNKRGEKENCLRGMERVIGAPGGERGANKGKEGLNRREE